MPSDRVERRDRLAVRLRIVRLAMDGVPAARIPKLTKIPARTVWNNLIVGERDGIIERVPGTRSPAVFRAGPQASRLINAGDAGGWPVVPVALGGSQPPGLARVHAVNFCAEIIRAPPPEKDLRWNQNRPYGNCPSRSATVDVAGIGTVKLRVLGRSRLMVYTPSLYATKDELKRLLDVLATRVYGVLAYLTKRYGYQFQKVRLSQQPEYAFKVTKPEMVKLLARYKPRNDSWWVDASPESGGAEEETRDLAKALKHMDIDDRVDRLEKIVEDHGRTLREIREEAAGQRKSLEKLVGVLEHQQRNAEELTRLMKDEFAIVHWSLKEIRTRLDSRTDQRKEN